MPFWKYTTNCVALLSLLLISCARKAQYSAEYYTEPTKWVHPPIMRQHSSASEPLRNVDTLSFDTSIDRMLSSARYWKKHEGILSGYSIQLYKGVSRTQADKLQRNVKGNTPTLLVYKQPYYILWTGFFAHPLLAYMQLRRLKKKFPQAIITPKRITVQECINMNDACP